MVKTLFRQNGLPDLPKKNRKREADFGLVFRKLIEKNLPKDSYAFELKDTNGKSYFNFNELGEDQINHALRNKSKKGNLIRIINGTKGSPDYVYLKNCVYSFIVIRYPNIIVAIDIDDFINEKEKSNRKSLTESRALEISSIVY